MATHTQMFQTRKVTVQVPVHGSTSWTDEDGNLKALACQIYGGAAVQVGQPEKVQGQSPDGHLNAGECQVLATDTIANVLAWLAHSGGDAEQALESAQVHFQAESERGQDDG